MSQEPFDLKPFARRVRLLHAWKGMAWGLLAGAGVCLAWLALDWTGAAYAEVPWMLGLLAASGLIGAAEGWLRRIREDSLALSIDMRAGLDDRVSTAWELRTSSAPMEEAQREDAASRVAQIKPQTLFPWKFTRWHSAALAASILPVAALYLLTSSLLASPGAKAKAEKAANQAAQLERVAKPIEEASKKTADPLAPGKRELAREMQKLARDLRRNRLNEEQTMQRANALNDKAKELSEKQLELAKSQLAPLKASAAEAALRKSAEQTPALSPSELRESALKDAERSLLNDLKQSALSSQSPGKSEGQRGQEGKDSEVSPEEAKALENQGVDPELAKLSKGERGELQREINRQMKELAGKKTLSEAERQKMELLRELADKLKMTDEAEKALKELMDTQEYKDLQEALAELEQKMEEAQQRAGDEDRPMTQEEMEQIRKAAEQYQEALRKFAEDMKDPAKKEEMLQGMRDLMEKIKNGGLNLEACRTCLSILPLPMTGAGLTPGSPSPGGLEGGVFRDTDQINKLDKPDPGTGKGIATRVRGVRDPKKGSESYIEVKAPTFSGTRSSVPYSQVLPQYRRQAERAIDRQQVPKADEAKVRRYFDSLTGARP